MTHASRTSRDDHGSVAWKKLHTVRSTQEIRVLVESNGSRVLNFAWSCDLTCLICKLRLVWDLVAQSIFLSRSMRRHRGIFSLYACESASQFQARHFERPYITVRWRCSIVTTSVAPNWIREMQKRKNEQTDEGKKKKRRGRKRYCEYDNPFILFLLTFLFYRSSRRGITSTLVIVSFLTRPTSNRFYTYM